MKLFFHGRALHKGEHFICEGCKTRRDYQVLAHREIPVWSAILVQFGQGGRSMATALIRHCDECRKGDKRNDYRTGWTSAPDCGGECCTGKVSREVRAHELRTRSEGVRVTAVGGAGGRGTVVLGNNGMDRGTLLVEKRA